MVDTLWGCFRLPLTGLTGHISQEHHRNCTYVMCRCTSMYQVQYFYFLRGLRSNFARRDHFVAESARPSPTARGKVAQKKMRNEGRRKDKQWPSDSNRVRRVTSSPISSCAMDTGNAARFVVSSFRPPLNLATDGNSAKCPAAESSTIRQSGFKKIECGPTSWTC